VRIPKLTDQAAETVLRADDANAPGAQPPVRKLGSRLAPIAAVVLVATLVIALGLEASKGLIRANIFLEERSAAHLQPQEKNSSLAASGGHESEPALPFGIGQDDGPVAVEARPISVPAGWYVAASLPAALSVCALMAFLLFARRQLRTDDSPDFRRALALLRPWIVLGGDSPRSLKRFVNSLRYIAMRFRATVDPPTPWERLLTRVRGWLYGKAELGPESSPRHFSLEEPILVALAAIYRCNERWLDVHTRMNADTIYPLLEADFFDRFPDASERRRVAARLAECIDKFNSTFPTTPLYRDEMQDHRHIVAFCDVMATAAGAPEPYVPERACGPTQLHTV